MDIPYTVELRRDTGLNNGKIGIWLFLASEVMLFGALFASYILIRTGAPSWPRGDTILDVPLATFNTIVLIASSVTMVMAWASLMRRRFGTYRIYMGATILLGLTSSSSSSTSNTATISTWGNFPGPTTSSPSITP